MDLPTHAAFGFAIGLIFFGHPEIGLLVALGALMPDLDRDWLEKADAFPEEKRHRAILHNVFVMGLAYLFSPFLALGIFIHMLQDSLTTAKDRGCEWLYPISRLVKHGILAGNSVDLHPNEHIYFYQEDPEDKDEDRPAIPWRRVYGPALNSKLLDRGFLFGSILLILTWFGFEYFSKSLTSITDLAPCIPHLLLLTSIVILLVTGATFNREKQNVAVDKNQKKHLNLRDAVKYLLVATSLTVVFLWIWFYQTGIVENIETIQSYWIPIAIGGFLLVASSVVVLKWYTRDNRDTFV
jgi:hypothetical protein